MDKSGLSAVAAQLQQVVAMLQSMGGSDGSYGVEQQPLPTWASIDARLPARPYQPLVSRQKHIVDLAAELAPSQGAPMGMNMGPDEYGMPQENNEAAMMTSMGMM